MHVTELESLDGVASQQWDDLLAHCADSTVFQTRAWLQAWCESVPAQGSKLRIFAAREGDRLLGLAPLVGLPAARRGAATSWHLIGEDYSDYQIFPVREPSFEILDALFAALDRGLPRHDSVVFRDVPQFSALGIYLERRRAARGGVLAGSWTACPALPIRDNAAGVERVLRKTSLRRHDRALRRLGDVSVEHFSRHAEVEPLLPGLFAQHIARWQGSAHPSLFEKEINQSFYRAAAARLGASGALLFTAVRLNGQVVAQQFGLRSRNDLLWYKPAFDRGFARYGPGEVLLKHLIEHARANGLDAVDFTRGDERFKRRFASRIAFNRHFTWYRSAARYAGSRALAGARMLLRRWRAR